MEHDHMTNVVNLKPSKTSKPDAALIRNCVEYAQCVGAYNFAFKADPDGNSETAESLNQVFERRARKALHAITSTPAKSAIGIEAKRAWCSFSVGIMRMLFGKMMKSRWPCRSR